VSEKNNISGAIPADILWRDNLVPESSKYGDVYFHPKDGLEESTYNFIEGNNLPSAWSNHDNFVIGELGFGTGLNFFLTWKLWSESFKKQGSRLHYISFEKHPLSEKDLAKAILRWPELKPFLDKLLPLMPSQLEGFHRVVMPKENLYLTLVYGDAVKMLPELQAKVNAWYLDGFTPSRNPELWSESLFKALADCSAEDATCSTFSAARAVKDALNSCGFSFELKKGYGAKRQMLVGKRNAEAQDSTERTSKKKVAIVGSGIAGALTAYALSLRGIEVSVFEKGEAVACGTSGNAAGVVTPYPTAAPSTMGEFFLCGHEFAWQQILSLSDVTYSRCGVIRLAVNSQLNNLKNKLNNLEFPEGYALACSDKELEDLSSFKVEKEGLYFPTGGWLNPIEYCQAALSSDLIEVHLNSEVTSVSSGETPEITLKDGSTHKFDSIVLANAFDASSLIDMSDFRFELTRGQLLSCKQTESTKNLSKVFCYDGYILPAIDGQHVVGATYDRENLITDVIDSQNTELLETVSKYLDEPLTESELISSRVGMRSSAADRRPYAGEYFPNIYLNISHGSRGLVSAGLCAELVASQLVGDPLPLGKELTRTLSPHRRSR